MTDASVTASAVICITMLIERVRQSPDLDAAAELALVVERAIAEPRRTVSAAFKLGRRGGNQPHRAERQRQRDSAIRQIGETLPAQGVEERARSIEVMLKRYAA